MAQTESKIRLIFDGVERGVVAAATKSAAGIRRLATAGKGLDETSDNIGKVAKAALSLGAAGAGLNVIGGAVGAVTALSGAALLVPGAALAGAAAMTTFKIATSGFGDAVKAGLAGDVEKFTKATKDMSPEMLAAAVAVRDMKPQVDSLKATVQDNFWGQFSGDITTLGNNYLPTLETGLGGIATQMGTVAKGAIDAANTPFFQGAVTSILDSTAGFLREVAFAVGNVLTGLVGVGQVGASYLPRLGEWIGGIALRFSEWVQSLEGQNQIKAWIDKGIAAFGDLWAIVQNVGSILGSLFSGLGGDTTSFLGPLRELTAQLAQVAASQGAQTVLQMIGAALGVLAGWAPVLLPLGAGLYALVGAVNLVSGAVGVFNAVMAIARIGMITTAATAVAGWVSMAATAVVQAAIMAASWLVAFAPAILVGALIVGLVALVVANWNTIKTWTVNAWNAVSAAVTSAGSTIVSAVSSFMSGAVRAVSAAGSAIVSAARSFVSGTLGAITGMAMLPVRVIGYFVQMVTGGRVQAGQFVSLVSSIPGKVISLFSGAASWLINAGRAIIDGLMNGIRSKVNAVISYVRGIMAQIRAYFPFSPAKKGPFSGTGYTTYSGQALMTDFGKGMTAASPGVQAAASTVLGGAQASISAGGGSASGGPQVTFAGNTSDALATVIMGMVRTGKIQIKAA